MPIKRATAFTASDGRLCATLEEAQRHELAIIALAVMKKRRAGEDLTEAEKQAEADVAIEFAHTVHDNADAILDILTTGPRSRPSTRRVKGTTAPRRAAKAAAPAQVKQGLQEARDAVEAA